MTTSKKTIACINGPNLNMLGTRKPHFYGTTTLADINAELEKRARERDFELVCFQANGEGELVDFIQSQRGNVSGILINSGAFSFYGYALRDALDESDVPIVTVHLSNIYKRKDEFPEDDMISAIALGGVHGFKEDSYYAALNLLINALEKDSA